MALVERPLAVAEAEEERKKVVPTPFDPEGEGYDDVTAQKYIEMYPLTIPKPDKYIGDIVKNNDAFQAWVWHPDLNDYVKHSSSRDPETGMQLKGRKHYTWGLAVEADKKLGYELFKGKDGRYYSKKPKEMTIEEYRLFREQQKALINNLRRK